MAVLKGIEILVRVLCKIETAADKQETIRSEQVLNSLAIVCSTHLLHRTTLFNNWQRMVEKFRRVSNAIVSSLARVITSKRRKFSKLMAKTSVQMAS